MVLYCGRQKTKTGMCTNQTGLKMSGIGGFGGSKGSIRRYISRRVQANLKPCGPILRHGVIVGFRTGRCVKPALKCASAGGGVGRVNAPRFKCTKGINNVKETTDLGILYDYFAKFGLYPALFASRETLLGDLNHPIAKRLGNITHYETGGPNFFNLPVEIQQIVYSINAKQYSANVKGLGENLIHTLGSITKLGIYALFHAGYGEYVVFTGLDTSVIYLDKVKEGGGLFAFKTSHSIGLTSGA